MSLQKDITGTLILQVSRIFIGMALFILFTHLLGPEVFGKYLLFEGVVFLSSIFLDMGINDGLEKRISEGIAHGVVSGAILIKILTIIMFIITILSIQGVLNSYLGKSVAFYLIPAAIAFQSGRLYIHILRGEMKIRIAEALKLVQGVLFLSTSIVLISSGFGILSVIFGYSISWAMVAASGVWISETKLDLPHLENVQSLLAFSSHQFISNIGSNVYKWTDTLLVGLFLSGVHVTAYEATWRIASLVLVLSNSIGTVIFPTFSEWGKDGDYTRIVNKIPQLISLSILIVLPAIAGSLVLSEEILLQIFSPELTFAAPVLVILLVGKIPQTVNNVIGRTILAIDKPSYISKSTALLVSINILLNVIFIPLFGIIGAAVATTIAFSVHTFLNIMYLRRNLTIRIPINTFLISLVATVIMYLVVKVLFRHLSSFGIIGLLIVVTIGATIYLFLISQSVVIRRLFFPDIGWND